jgi:hypothetical protein
LGVVVEAEILIEGSGSIHCQMVTNMARPMATMALEGPRRLAIRRYFAPR